MNYKRLSADMKKMFFYSLIMTSGILALKNVALQKPARQSSDYRSSTADKAVDGNTDGNRYHGFCSTTNPLANSWWKVDLMGFYTIHSIKIFNRVDGWRERLQQFEIRVSSVNPTTFPSTEGQRYVYYPSIVPINGYTLACDQPITGRYVSVFKAANEHLTICEIRVFGERISRGSFGKKLINFRLNSPFVTSLLVVSSVKCAAVCLQTDTCFSYSFKNISSRSSHSRTLTCDLAGSTAFSDQPLVFSQPGWNVYLRNNKLLN